MMAGRTVACKANDARARILKREGVVLKSVCLGNENDKYSGSSMGRIEIEFKEYLFLVMGLLFTTVQMYGILMIKYTKN